MKKYFLVKIISGICLSIFLSAASFSITNAQQPDRYKTFVFGVDYYPEQWDEKLWEQDAQRMQDAGVNTVRIGEFAWGLMEPAEGKFDFSLFDRAIAVLAKHNIKVIFGTPTATPPKWLTQKYPEVLHVFATAQTSNDQTRRHVCYNSPVYRRMSKRIVAEIAKHFKNNPNINGWQIDNEFNNENKDCYSGSCRIAFRGWLKDKYKTLPSINDRWGTTFWSQTYTDWNQIDLPFTATSLHNPSLMLDYKRFISDSVESFMQDQIDIIRRYRPADYITQNGVFKNINYYKFSRNLDLHSSANYPLFSDDPQYGTGTALTGHRSYTGRFMIMEQQTGAGGQTYLLRSPQPGEMRLWTWQSIAHGADGIVHFRWRTARKGIEEYWQGVLDQDNVPRARYEDFKKEGAEVNKVSADILGSKIVSDIAVIKDFEDEWVYDHQYLTDEVHVGWAYNDLFRAASEQKQNIDFISPDGDLNKYKIVFAPYAILMDEKLSAKLKAFVAQGGTLIMSAHIAVKDRDNTMTDQTIPIMGMRELFGVEVDAFHTYQPPSKDKNALKFDDGTEVPVQVFADILKPTTAKTIASWDRDYLKGSAAVTENRNGKGLAVYYGSFFNTDAARYLLSRYAKQKNLQPIFNGFPASIEVTRRTKGNSNYYFILNHKNESVKLSIGNGYFDMLGGKNADANFTLAPFGYKVLRKGN
jgi:beta-galactosidase